MKVAIVTAAFLSLGIGGMPFVSGSKEPARLQNAVAPVRPSRSVWDGVYTTGQAKRGSVQSERCAPCHGFDLEGDFAPPLVGPAFATKWDGRTLGDLFELIEMNFVAMNEKQHAPDLQALSRQQSADLLAYLLLESQFPGGQTELPGTIDLLRQIRFQVSRK